ncbi:Mbeg1-like protein [Methylomusa anaerophila]|uniref:Uncharacterized protein n=1 Tax=Methylomusa anaerophila TaxID=1930071 RepID=A0A348AI90_9FIRM|nr:Mbeg1-like protein [Methylomusa anaerophila]BBB90788.1 hypothetical protein MAMMFC1_01449 [Methylomusa anaerophila]
MGGGGWIAQALGIIFPPLQPIVQYYSAAVAIEHGDVLGLITSIGASIGIPQETINYIAEAQSVVTASQTNDWASILAGTVGKQLGIDAGTRRFISEAQTVYNTAENGLEGFLASGFIQQQTLAFLKQAFPPPPIVMPDGTIRQNLYDGSVRETAPDGTVKEISKKDGVITVTESNGTKTVYIPNGPTTVYTPDGSVIIWRDGIQVMIGPDGTIVTKFPDGSRQTLMPNGTYLTWAADGSQTVTSPNGSQIVYGADHSVTLYETDGTKRVYADDGTETVYQTDGTTIVNMSDGRVTTTTADGAVTVIDPDGKRTEYDIYGNKTVFETNGTMEEYAPDNTMAVTEPNGARTLTLPDNTQMVIDTNGIRTVTEPGGTQTSFGINGTVKVTEPSGMTTEYTPNGTRTVYDTDGIQTIYKTNGTRVVIDTDNTRTMFKVDGTKVVFAPDGKITEYTTDGKITEYTTNGNKTETAPDGNVTVTPNSPYPETDIANPIATATTTLGGLQANAVDTMIAALGTTTPEPVTLDDGKQYILVSGQKIGNLYIPREEYGQFMDKFNQSLNTWLAQHPEAQPILQNAFDSLNQAQSQLQLDSNDTIIQNQTNAQILQTAATNFYDALQAAGMTDFFDGMSGSFDEFHFKTVQTDGVPEIGDGLYSGMSYFVSPGADQRDLNTQTNAALSSYVYRGADATDIPEGLQSIGVWSNPESGYHAEAFTNGEKIIVAFRGTDQYLTDGPSDLQLAAGRKVEQFADVRQTYNQLIDIINDPNSELHGLPIMATGHSLGGAEAQFFTALGYQKDITIVSETFGAPGIAESLAREGIFVTDPNVYAVVNHVNVNDVFGQSTCGGHLGVVRKYDMSPWGFRGAFQEHDIATYESYLNDNPIMLSEYCDKIRLFGVPMESNAQVSPESVLTATSFLLTGNDINSTNTETLVAQADTSLLDNTLAYDMAGFVAESNDTGVLITAGNSGLPGDSSANSLLVTTAGNELYNQDQTKAA